MIEAQLENLWQRLQGKKPHLPHYLTEIRLNGLRDIQHLRVIFDYPVSVIAGGNATGKSTILFEARQEASTTWKMTSLSKTCEATLILNKKARSR